MNKSVIGVSIALVFVIGAVFLVSMNNSDDTDDQSNSGSSTKSEIESKTEDSTTVDTESSNTVKIENFAFGPKDIKIKAGTTVTWTNNDSAKHDVSPDIESNDFRKSELLARGESFSFTFETPGVYSYHCTPHPNMTATVTVE